MYYRFQTQSNITRAMTGEVNDNGYLLPGTELTVRIYWRRPIDALLVMS